MNDINQIILEGTCSTDASIKTTARGWKYGSVTIEHKVTYPVADGKTETEVRYFDIEARNTLADFMFKKCKKGVHIRVVGRLTYDCYRNDFGKLCSKSKVLAEHFEVRA